MQNRPQGAPTIGPISYSDIVSSLRAGIVDFRAAPVVGLVFASFYVAAGWLMAGLTVATGTTFWLVLAVLGFPLIGAFAALGLYETSRRRQTAAPLHLGEIARVVWNHKVGQLPWLALILIILFLFWFFLGHMIFALFLGLSAMTHITTSLDVFLTAQGLQMLGFGSLVGAGFACLTFAISVLGMPMFVDQDVDFVTAMITSVKAVRAQPLIYFTWAGIIAALTFLAMIPAFLGLFVVMPVLGHATWHLYQRAKAAGQHS